MYKEKLTFLVIPAKPYKGPKIFLFYPEAQVSYRVKKNLQSFSSRNKNSSLDLKSYCSWEFNSDGREFSLAVSFLRELNHQVVFSE